MGTGRRDSEKPLWKSGSHLRTRGASALHRPPTSKTGPPDDVEKWMRANTRAPNSLRLVSLPCGEVTPNTSGVLGAYQVLPQATARLFDHFMDSDRAHRADRHGDVPGSDRSGIFLKKILATPLVHHNFAS